MKAAARPRTKIMGPGWAELFGICRHSPAPDDTRRAHLPAQTAV
jgi:hypothetical protein